MGPGCAVSDVIHYLLQHHPEQVLDYHDIVVVLFFVHQHLQLVEDEFQVYLFQSQMLLFDILLIFGGLFDAIQFFGDVGGEAGNEVDGIAHAYVVIEGVGALFHFEVDALGVVLEEMLVFALLQLSPEIRVVVLVEHFYEMAEKILHLH